jgi:hypothetical protein
LRGQSPVCSSQSAVPSLRYKPISALHTAHSVLRYSALHLIPPAPLLLKENGEFQYPSSQVYQEVHYTLGLMHSCYLKLHFAILLFASCHGNTKTRKSTENFSCFFVFWRFCGKIHFLRKKSGVPVFYCHIFFILLNVIFPPQGVSRVLKRDSFTEMATRCDQLPLPAGRVVFPHRRRSQ